MLQKHDMVRAESEKTFHKKKALNALDKVKDAVDNEDLESISHHHIMANHHIDEIERLLSDSRREED